MTADAPMCVLLVEDDASYAALIAAELRGAAIDLHQAGSLAAAASEIPRRSFDAILLDLGLPDSSGIDLAREALARFAGLRVVLATGYQEGEAGSASGSWIRLPKPYHSADLQRVLSTIL